MRRLRLILKLNPELDPFERRRRSFFPPQIKGRASTKNLVPQFSKRDGEAIMQCAHISTTGHGSTFINHYRLHHQSIDC
jgi:hypothetical protein